MSKKKKKERKKGGNGREEVVRRRVRTGKREIARERDENEKEIAFPSPSQRKDERKEEKNKREGRDSPLHCEKERSDGLIFHRHYFSLLRAEERREK